MKNHVKPLYCCGTPVLPAVYGESLSFMEIQGKMQYNINQMIENQEDFDERLNSANDDIDALEGRVDTAEGDIDALEGRMDDAERHISNAEGDIDSLEGRMDGAERDIDALEGRMDGAEGDIDNIQDQIGTNRLGTSVPTYDVQFNDHTYGANDGVTAGTFQFVKNAVSVANNIGHDAQVEPATVTTVKVGGWDELVASIPVDYSENISGITVSAGGSETVSRFEFYNNATIMKLVITVYLNYDVRVTGSYGTVTVNIKIDGNDNIFTYDYADSGDVGECITMPYTGIPVVQEPNQMIGNHVVEVVVSATDCSLS